MVEKYVARIGILLAVLAWVSLGARSVARGADDEVAQAVNLMLRDGWKPSLKGLKAAEARYQAAKQQAPADVRVQFAMALISLQNHRHKEAAHYLDEALSGSKAMLPIRRVRIYVAVMMRDSAAIQREMKSLADKLAGEPLSGGAETPSAEAAQFLGSIFEYLASHSGNLLKSAEVAQMDLHFKATLKGSRAEAFTAGRNGTTKQGEELQASVAAEKQKAQDALAVEITNLKSQSDANATRQRNHIETNEAERAKHEAQAKLDNQQIDSLESAVKDLKAKVAKIEREAKAGDRDVVQIEREIDDLKDKLREAKRDKDGKSEENKIERKLDQAKRELSKAKGNAKEKGDTDALERQIGAKQAEINRLENGSAAIRFMRQYRAALQQYAAEAQTLAGRLTECQTVQDKYDKTDNINPATNALITKAKAFSSYVEISLDDERDRILATYRK